MRGLELLLALVLVSNVMAEEELTNKEMKALFEAYEKMATKMTKAVLEMDEEEANIVREEMTDIEERDADRPLGL